MSCGRCVQGKEIWPASVFWMRGIYVEVPGLRKFFGDGGLRLCFGLRKVLGDGRLGGCSRSVSVFWRRWVEAE